MNHSLVKWEVAGVIFIFILGSLLHFTFEWSGYSTIVAFVAPVNESVWEHNKMAFWPGLLFALIEWHWVKKWAENFWLAKSLGLLLMPISILLIFYSYTAVVGRHYLIADIITFLVAVIIGQAFSCYLMSTSDKGLAGKVFGVILILIMMVTYSVFTFYPPQIDLFLDHHSNAYGLNFPIKE